MTTLKELQFAEILTAWEKHQRLPELAAFRSGFLLFYSSIWGGVSSDPKSFFVPIDDHGFHRGDGVFEAIRAVRKKPYLMTEHLERLGRSAAAIGLQLPYTLAEMAQILAQMAEKAGEEDLILRVFATRGPGGFGVNPKDSPSTRFYAVATRFKPMAEELWSKGVRLGLSRVTVKPDPFAGIKSLNYLPNVLMKKEAIESGFDFTVGFDAKGFITEGATENVAIISKTGELQHPHLHSILHGCTMKRAFDLAEKIGLVKTSRGVDLTEKDLREAKEVFLIGTALDVTPVGYLIDTPITPGPLARALRDLLRKDQA